MIGHSGRESPKNGENTIDCGWVASGRIVSRIDLSPRQDRHFGVTIRQLLSAYNMCLDQREWTSAPRHMRRLGRPSSIS